MNKISRLAATSVTLLLLLASCSSGNDELSVLENQTLANSAHKCRGVKTPAPGFAIACSNIYRECQRRSEQLGYKLC